MKRTQDDINDPGKFESVTSEIVDLTNAQVPRELVQGTSTRRLGLWEKQVSTCACMTLRR